MNSIDRRSFLKRSFGSATAWIAGGIGGKGQVLHGGAKPEDARPPVVKRYVDRLPIPERLAPLRKSNNGTLYHVRMREFMHQMHSLLPPTRVWGYEGMYPGPTIEALRGERVQIEWENQLPEKHLFEVDPHIHGAMPPVPAVRTVPHLHGSRSPSDSDGLPEKWFTPGKTARYTYPNAQPAASLWYHDHALGITRLNVYAGLSGFYLLRDEEERGLDLPAGEYEIPLVVQDRSLDSSGQLIYAPTHEDGLPLPPGVWGPEFFGQLPVVNGAIFPYLDVEPCAYRLRILNSSNSRFFALYLNLAEKATDIPSLIPFQQIGTDGGLLSKPVDLQRVLLGPAERADLLVDFSSFEGKTITLSNNASSPYPGWVMTNMHPAPLGELMQFRVVLPLTSKAKPHGAGTPVLFRKLKEEEAVGSRDFVLSERFDPQARSLGVRINEKGYDDPVTEIVRLGSIEKWRFINTTDDAHPMHLHLVQFQILHRQGYDQAEFSRGSVRPVGNLRPPAANEDGWKDTAVVLPGEMLTILVPFEGYAGRYVFHCHMLEHEDNDMMRPYEVRQ